MRVLLGKQIKSEKDMKIGQEYWIDNEIHVLTARDNNRYEFATMYGTYIANRVMIDSHIKEGIFLIKSIAC